MTEDEKRIYSNAFSEIRLKRKYHSPFRPDPTPSFEFYINNRSKRLWWRDWGTGETGNCYDFLDRWSGEITPRGLKIIEAEKKEPPKIVYKEVWDLRFWSEFGISEKTLRFFKTDQVESVNGYRHNRSFIYWLKDSRYKVYTPGAHLRFWGTMRKTDVFGWEQLPEKGNLLVITKSLKDVMVFYELGIPAIALASETISPSKELIAELKSRFSNIVLLYDKDREGIKQSERIGSIYGIKRIFMETAKDISDCVKAKSLKAAEKEFWEKYLENEKGKTKYDYLQSAA